MDTFNTDNEWIRIYNSLFSNKVAKVVKTNSAKYNIWHYQLINLIPLRLCERKLIFHIFKLHNITCKIHKEFMCRSKHKSIVANLFNNIPAVKRIDKISARLRIFQLFV